MKRLITIIITSLLPMMGLAQIKFLYNSFDEIHGFVDLNDKTDDNGKPFSVLIVKSTNINDEDFNNIIFSTDVTSTIEAEYRAGEAWLYIPYYSNLLKMRQPNMQGFDEFYFPYNLTPKQGYEITITRYNTESDNHAKQFNYFFIRSDQPEAVICIDGDFVGIGEGGKSCEIGKTYSWTMDCHLFHSISGEVTITDGEPISIEKRMKPAFGLIKITSEPENGATVFVDNMKVGVTPYTTERLSVGEHNVSVLKEMYKPQTITVNVSEGLTSDAIMIMQPNFATVNVSTTDDADIFIDGEKKGKGQWSGRLFYGYHLLEARKDFHRTSSLSLNLPIGITKDITIPNPDPIFASIEMNTMPQGAKILIDNDLRGISPCVISDVLIGNHVITVEKEGWSTVEHRITLKEGDALSLNDSLPSGRDVTITTNAQGDKIYTDGRYIGDSPVKTNLTIGEHRVKAERNGMAIEKQLIVTENNDDVFNISFDMIVSVNGVTFEMVRVDGGKFKMGATAEQKKFAENDESRTHNVTLNDYYIGKYEVTQSVWNAVMDNDQSAFKGPNRPVERVSWNDCQEFIRRLNEATGKNFRLPTEAEWEYAARGGKKSHGFRYSGSDKIDEVAWYSENSGNETHDVGQKKPNELGIYDMSGNVWEWCSDWYLKKYKRKSQKNPIGPNEGSNKVFRGSCWNNNANSCRVSNRHSNNPVYSLSYTGLRLVLVE
ncbi:MAG: SUMF1/EgtB/PvdO family nonheme iron enzyme [Candidatus Limimorpha sp.]